MSEGAQRDRELFIDILNPDASTAESVRQGRSYTWEVGQLTSHRIAADRAGYERGQRETVERIVAWLRKPLTLIRGISMAQNERLSDAIEAGEWK